MADSNGSVGVVLELPQCPECGGYPLRVDYLFDISSEKRMREVRGEMKQLLKERRTYLHCSCGHCTTDWYRPEYDSVTDNVNVSAFDRAKEAYIKKIWVGMS